MSPPRRGNRARAKSRAGRPLRRPSRARWRSKRSTARCAARARRRRLMRARTGLLPGCSEARKREYDVPLPEKGEAKRAILDSYTKEHSAEYQSQALIDLARRMGPKIGDLAKVESIVIHTSHHTHMSSAPAPTIRRRWTRKRAAKRSTIRSCTSSPSRSKTAAGTTNVPMRRSAPARENTIALWRKIITVEDAEWTRRYHSRDPGRKGVWRPRGGDAEGRLGDRGRDRGRGRPSVGRAAVWAAGLYPQIPQALAEGVVAPSEQDRFIAAVERLATLKSGELVDLSFTVDPRPACREFFARHL